MLWTHTGRMDSSTQKRGEDGWFSDWLRVIMVKLMIMMLKKRRRGKGDVINYKGKKNADRGRE